MSICPRASALRVSSWSQAMQLDCKKLVALARADGELALKLGRLSARVRIGPTAEPLDVVISDGSILSVDVAAGTADVVVVAPDAFWAEALQRQPRYVANSLTIGATIEGDVERLVAPY